MDVCCNRYIPLDIVEEILLNLPVKSLIRFQCVSRWWNSKISEPSFIRKHLTIMKRRPHLVVNHESYYEIENSSVLSISDDHYFIGDREPLICPFYNVRVRLRVSCEELWCIEVNESLFLWNPSMRRCRQLPDPPHRRSVCRYCTYGMGYDPVGDDYKVLRLPCINDDYEKLHRPEWRSGVMPRGEIELCSLRSDAWRMIQPQLALKPRKYGDCAHLNGALHWMVYSRNLDKYEYPSAIFYFDLSTDKHGEVAQPEYCPTPQAVDTVHLVVLKGKLCVFLNYYHTELVLWVMKDYGVQESWSITHHIRHDTNPSFSPKIRRIWYSLIPMHLYEDGQMLVLIDRYPKKWEIVIYKDECTMIRPVVARDCPKFRDAFMYVESLISPLVWRGSPQISNDPA